MKNDWQAIDSLLEEMIRGQQKAAFKCAERIIPHITEEDLLQPNDFTDLEGHPVFRYEEGIIAGLQSAQIALRALKKDREIQ